MDTKQCLLEGLQSSRRSSSLYALSLSTVDTVVDMREHAAQASPRVTNLTCPLTQASISSSASSIDTRSASSTFSASVASSSRGATARAKRRTQEPSLTDCLLLLSCPCVNVFVLLFSMDIIIPLSHSLSSCCISN